ncbi:DUF6458 family protein [Monashia sp. NPDC004114]
MGLGVLLAVIGAILTFAVRAHTSVINITVVGIILMVAGAGLIIHARRGTRHERIVTREEVQPGSSTPTQTVTRVIEEREIE